MKNLISSIALLMLAVSSVGQTLKTYNGPYEEGNVTYTYYEDENGERVRHGKFTYTESYPGISSFTVTGSYKNGMKDGRWTFKDISRNRKETKILNLVDGNLEGYISKTTQERNSAAHTERYQMKNNRLIGMVKMKDNNIDACGQFDDEGFPDGVWVNKYKNEYDGSIITETEEYVHGVLVSKQKKNEITGEIWRQKFYLEPRKFIAAYNSDNDTVVVDSFFCKQIVRFAHYDWPTFIREPEVLYSQKYAFVEDDWPDDGDDWNRIPDNWVKKIDNFFDYGYGQNDYQGIPFKEIVIIGKEPAPNEGEAYTVGVEQMPQFPGGKEALDKYLKEELRYPSDAVQQGIQGSVMVRFIVNRDGSISDAVVSRGILKDEAGVCSKEALRLVNAMPKWVPGKLGNKNVRVYYTLPITFSL